MEVNENKIKWSMSVFKLHKITHSIEKFKIGILKKKMRGQMCPTGRHITLEPALRTHNKSFWFYIALFD